MPRDLTHALEELKRTMSRQDEDWAEVESQLRALSELGIAISREVIEEIDQAFNGSPRAALIHHLFC